METKNITVKEIVHSLDYYELLKIKKDLSDGSFQMKKLVNDKIKDIEKQHMTNCTTCSADINMEKKSNFTIIFGPHDFRKKATFCGKDCLLYFLNQLR